jgi:hypothetical protein
LQAARAAASSGRSLRFPLSTSTKCCTSDHPRASPVRPAVIVEPKMHLARCYSPSLKSPWERCPVVGRKWRCRRLPCFIG